MLFGNFVLNDCYVRTRKLGFFFFEFFFQFCDGAVFKPCGGFELAFSLSVFKLVLSVLDFFLKLLDMVDISSFRFPLCGEFLIFFV